MARPGARAYFEGLKRTPNKWLLSGRREQPDVSRFVVVQVLNAIYTEHDELQRWCNEMFGHRHWYSKQSQFAFSDAEKAALFMLRYSDFVIRHHRY